MTQERIPKPVPQKTTEQDAKELAEQDAALQEAATKAADLTATDELLDEIDGLLEENAEEFVRNYVQKGGQLAQTAWDNVKGGFREIVYQVWQRACRPGTL